MNITLGHDEHGGNVTWDTDTSPMLNIHGPEQAGKSTLLDHIIRQADRRMAVTRFTRENRPLPSPTVMAVTYPTTRDDRPGMMLDILQRVEAEQQRRMKQTDLNLLDAKPLMLAFDDFTPWALNADREELNTLNRILQKSRRTRVSLILASRDYTALHDTLKQRVGQTCLCDAGTHIILATPGMGEPLRPANRDVAGMLLTRITLADPNRLTGHGILQTNSGGIHALTTTIQQA